MGTKETQKVLDNGKLIRVDTAIWEKVKNLTDKTRQSIGGFFSLAAEEKLQKDKK